LKKQAPQLWETFLQSLAWVQAEEKGLSAITHLKALQHREEQHQIFWQIWSIIKLVSKQRGLTVVIDNQGKECNTHVCKKTKLNLIKQSDTPLFQEPVFP